mgnify:CR=1 FL=1
MRKPAAGSTSPWALSCASGTITGRLAWRIRSLPSSRLTTGRHTDLDKVIIDEQTGTVYIEDALLRLDVGAIAKGYACQLVKQELTEAGFESFVISAGGNVCTAGEPAEEGQTAWLVGIQNPDTQAAAEIVDTLEVRDKSVVTAGGYQRYYTVNGERYHHIIDKDTYMPANYYESVTTPAWPTFCPPRCFSCPWTRARRWPRR